LAHQTQNKQIINKETVKTMCDSMNHARNP